MKIKEWLVIISVMIIVAVLVSFVAANLTGNAIKIKPNDKATYQGVLQMLSENCKVQSASFLSCNDLCKSNGAVALNTQIMGTYKTSDGETDFIWVETSELNDKVISDEEAGEELIIETVNGAPLDIDVGCLCCSATIKTPKSNGNLSETIINKLRSA